MQKYASTSTKIEVAIWLQQVESEIKFYKHLRIPAMYEVKMCNPVLVWEKKEKDNHYKLKEAIAIAIGLICKEQCWIWV